MCQREQVHQFIETNLFELNPNDEDAQSNGFVLIRRFPTFNPHLLDEHHELMNLGLTTILTQTKNSTQKLICCIWTLCCMIESDRVALGSKGEIFAVEGFPFHWKL